MKHVCLVVVVLFSASAVATPANQGEASTSVNAWPIRLTDTSRNLTLLNSAPGSDSGQVAVPVRIISSLSLMGGSGLTDAQLRASAVPVSGTFWQTTQPVSGTFWQSTQPISGTVTANAGTGTLATSSTQLPSALDGSGYLKTHEQGTATVSVSGTVPVSGTFWQATQPVSGTFFQATQPVSGSVSVSNFPASQAVTGTFFQATQPVSGTVTANAGSGTMAVSGPLTDTQLRATAVPVSGTFYQATQPVSGTVTANAGSGTLATSATQLPAALDGSGFLKTHEQGTATVSGSVTANIGTSGSLALDATLTGGTQKTKLVDTGGTNAASVSAGGALKVDGSAATQPVSGTFWQATQPVSGTFWQATQPVSGTFWQATQPVSGTVAATESGTWTVQPGNTPNSTPWLTNDSATSATASAVPAKSIYAGGVATALGSAPTALSAGNLAGLAMDTQGRLLVNNFHPNLVVCNLLTTATTSTSLSGSCGAPGASKSVWITDVSVGGGVATSATAPAIVQTGTGGSCGTGTVVLYRCNHGATASCEAHFSTPIKASANAEVCILDGVTGTKSVTLSGFIAP